MLKLAKHPSVHVRACLASNKNISISILEMLVQQNHPEIDEWAVINPKMPLYLLKNILQRKNEFVCYRIAGKVFPLPEEIIRELSQSEYKDVRKKLAERSDLSEEILVSLLKDSDDSVRFYAASNENLRSESVLKVLMNSSDEFILKGLAINPNLTEEMFAVLCRHNNRDIRQQLTENTKVPKNILDVLLRDPDSRVRASALLFISRFPNSDLSSVQIDGLSWEEGVALAMNKDASPEQLQKLSRHPHSSVRSAVAAHNNTSKDVLIYLSSDNSSGVGCIAQDRLKSYNTSN